MHITHTFFADESGNSGMNYLDEAQPFHVEAGFLIPNAHLAAAQSVIRTETARPAMKGKDLMASDGGRRKVAKILQAIERANALPFFIVMEKPFSIAGKLVDVFLDPEHQDAVDWLPMGDIAQREQVTERLFNILPFDLLARFAELYRFRSFEAEHPFRELLCGIVQFLESRAEVRLAQSFAGAIHHLSVILHAERYGKTPDAHAEWAALNLPAFNHLVKLVDAQMDTHEGKFRITHDRQKQFEKIFERSLETLRRSPAHQIDYRLANGPPTRQQLQNFEGFSTADATAEPMILAADILASCVRRLVQDVAAGNGSGIDKDLVQLTLPALITLDDNPPPFAGIYASARTKNELLRALDSNALLTDADHF